MPLSTAEPEALTTPTQAAPDPPTGPPQFESWGRYPKYSARVVPLNWRSDFPAALAGAHNGALPVGLGRSYADVCLLEGGTLLQTTGMSRLIDFDPDTGILTAEAGISLAQILDFAVPRGFFLPVTPGTKYVTLGGAIANDIHGKNHEAAGSFGNHVPCFELVRSDGSRRLCSATENPDWYAATIGGMGLTGLITWAQLRLRPIVSRGIDYEGIQFHGIDEFLELKQRYSQVEYTVSWLDCVSTGRNFARGIFMLGEHSEVPGELKRSPEPKLVFPFDAPAFALNRTAVSMFNTVFFHKQRKAHVKALKDYEPFFYPLDAVLHWNRMYGKRGLMQFQYAIPWEHAKEGTIAHSARDRQVRPGQLPGGAQGVRRHSFARHDELSAAWHHVRARLSHQAGRHLSAAEAPRRHDAGIRRPPVSRQGRSHDRGPVSGLLPGVAPLRAFPRSHAHLQLLGACHRFHRSQTDPMSTPSTLDPQPSTASPASLTPNAKITKKILVLGATSGIAEATCRIWAAQGAQLFLVARNPEKLAAVAADLKLRGAAYVGTAVADLDSTDKHAELLAHAVNSLTGMDIAYLAYGILGDQARGEQDFEHAAQILHTNFVAPVSLLTWLANFCVQRRSGVLAVISSVAGERGRKSNYLYGSSKAGLTAFLAGLRNRIDRQGVTVLTIKPGPVNTAMTAHMDIKKADVNKVAAAIVKAIDAKKDNLYVPGIFQPIMFIIRNIPERIFKKLNL